MTGWKVIEAHLYTDNMSILFGLGQQTKFNASMTRNDCMAATDWWYDDGLENEAKVQSKAVS